MKNKESGWVIINTNHPANPRNKMIYHHTFSRTRKEAIANFIEGSGWPWWKWKRKYNFRVVKAESVITVIV